MTLIEHVQRCGEWADDETLFVARPWQPHSQAMIVTPSPHSTAPIDRGGVRFEYFLETFLARDFLEDFAVTAEGRNATQSALCERLISYAENDA